MPLMTAEQLRVAVFIGAFDASIARGVADAGRVRSSSEVFDRLTAKPLPD
jgi:hypothetical protein